MEKSSSSSSSSVFKDSTSRATGRGRPICKSQQNLNGNFELRDYKPADSATPSQYSVTARPPLSPLPHQPRHFHPLRLANEYSFNHQQPPATSNQLQYGASHYHNEYGPAQQPACFTTGLSAGEPDMWMGTRNATQNVAQQTAPFTPRISNIPNPTYSQSLHTPVMSHFGGDISPGIPWSMADYSNTHKSFPTISELSLLPRHTSAEQVLDSDDDSSDSNGELTHPNKYPVQIENHDNQHCVYKRQPTRSGPKVKQRTSAVYNPNVPSLTEREIQHVKYYQKDLVRICRCGRYAQMDGALVHGRANDCDGYEIHYSQKCKWKAYDDFKTGKRVLIRLCKCYKPVL